MDPPAASSRSSWWDSATPRASCTAPSPRIRVAIVDLLGDGADRSLWTASLGADTRVPSPRTPQLTYHGVLAPAAAWRDLVVPAPPESEPAAHLGAEASRELSGGGEQRSTPSSVRTSRRPWAELLPEFAF